MVTCEIIDKSTVNDYKDIKIRYTIIPKYKKYCDNVKYTRELLQPKYLEQGLFLLIDKVPRKLKKKLKKLNAIQFKVVQNTGIFGIRAAVCSPTIISSQEEFNKIFNQRYYQIDLVNKFNSGKIQPMGEINEKSSDT